MKNLIKLLKVSFFVFGLFYCQLATAQLTLVNTINVSNNGLCADDCRVFHFDGNGTLYAGTDGGGIGISADGGNTWTCLSTAQGIPNRARAGIVELNGKIFVGTILGGGVVVSADGGNTWTIKNAANGLTDGTIHRMSVIGNTLYASTSGGLFYSTDDGENWSAYTTANGLGTNLITCNVVESNGTLYTGSAPSNGNPLGGMNFSTDGGTTWTNKDMDDGLPHNFVQSVTVEGNTLYVGTLGGIASTTDNGDTWTVKTTADGLGHDAIRRVNFFNGNMYVSTQGGLSISTDGGNSFTNYNAANGVPNNSTHDLVLHEGLLYLGTFGGIGVIEDASLAIPTMGEWALIILGLIILSMSTVYVMRWNKTMNLVTENNPAS